MLEIQPQKLLPPATACPLMARDAILHTLTGAAAYRTVLLRAPAGYGKTSLLRLLYRRFADQGGRCAWLTCDASDNDPARLQLALHTALLDARPQDAEPAALADSTVTHLFLDDVERLEAPAIRLLLSMLGNLPPQARVFIGARTLHQVSVAALKAKRLLLELTLQDIRFTPDETRNYLRQAMLPHAEEELARLQQATEGWPAAIELSAIAWRDTGGATLPNLYHAGELGEYLVDEVFRAQESEVQAFLAATVALHTFSPELADAVRGRDDSAALLTRIRSAGLPLQPLQDNWFRYHPLFAEHIARHETAPAARQQQYARAAAWLLAHDRALEAFDYFIKAGQPEAAADALEGIAHELRRRCQFHSLLHACDQLPEALLEQRPALTLVLISALMYTSRSQDRVRWMAHIRRQAASFPAEPLYADAVRTYEPAATLRNGDPERGLALALQYWPQRAQSSPYTRSKSALAMAYMQLARGLLADAANTLIEARRACAEAGSVSGQVIACFLQAYHDAIQGEFDTADAQMLLVDQLVQQHSAHIAPTFLYSYGLGLTLLLAYERNQLDRIGRYLTMMQGIALPALSWDVQSAVLPIQARMRVLADGLPAAQRWLEQELIKLGDECTPQVREAVEAELARLAILAGNGNQIAGYAAHLLAAPAAAPERHIFSSQEIDGAGIPQVRLLLATGQVAPAIARLRGMLIHAEQTGRVWRATRLRVLLALALQREGDTGAAQEQLLQALAVGARAGMVRLFLDEGPELHAMLQQLQASAGRSLPGPVTGHLRTLLQLAGAGGAATPAPGKLNLTATECALLALVAKGLSNRDVANQLGISVNTVKWHLAQIFQKIHVANRSQAVFKARQAGLLA